MAEAPLCKKPFKIAGVYLFFPNKLRIEKWNTDTDS